MIYVVATIEIAEGMRNQFLEIFLQNVPLVQAEDGCLEYLPTLDVETSIAAQGGIRPNVVTVIEKWQDIESLETHLIAPHMIAYRAKVKDLVVGASLQILQPAAHAN